MTSKNKEKLFEKLKKIVLESNCNYLEVADTLFELRLFYAKKAKSLVNAANINEVNKF